jgi:hypothetical protein
LEKKRAARAAGDNARVTVVTTLRPVVGAGFTQQWYVALVAFCCTAEWGGKRVTYSSLNITAGDRLRAAA